MGRRGGYYSSGRGGSNNDAQFWLLMIVVAVILSVAILKLIAVLAVYLGLGLMVIAFLIFIAMYNNMDNDTMILAGFIFCIGFLLCLAGIGVTNYFQTNPLGMKLSNFSSNGISGMQSFFNQTIGWK